MVKVKKYLSICAQFFGRRMFPTTRCPLGTSKTFEMLFLRHLWVNYAKLNKNTFHRLQRAGKLYPWNKWRFPKTGGAPNSCILIGFSVINQLFWGFPIDGNPQIKAFEFFNNQHTSPHHYYSLMSLMIHVTPDLKSWCLPVVLETRVQTPPSCLSGIYTDITALEPMSGINPWARVKERVKENRPLKRVEHYWTATTLWGAGPSRHQR